LIEVKYVGYKTFTKTVNLSNVQELEIAMEPTFIEAKEVVVTGLAISSESKKNSTSVSSVNKEQLMARSSGNLVDAIAHLAGVSQISTGGAISKPVIRGLSYNRVVTLVDGAKQEGQQWGDEHGIEVDQFGADRVEVLRGAASLMYGSDALGGVINILEPLPAPLNQIKGELVSNYASNNGLNGNSLMLEGNQNGFVWRTRGSYKNAFAYQTPTGRIPNTGFNETDLSAQIGLNKRWGYTHLNLSSFQNNVGLPDFMPNANGQFEDSNGNIFTESQLKDRSLLLPFQNVQHYKAALNSNILFGENRLRSNISYQNNLRKEFEETTTDPALFFDLKTLSYDFKYSLAQSKGWEPVFGLSGSFQNSTNKGEEFLIPDYSMRDFGMFGYGKKTWTSTTFTIGARFDHRTMKGEQLFEGSTPKFSNFKTNYSNVSGALGITQTLGGNYNLKANLGSAFRAPNIAELSSEGVHEGTFRYEVGNTILKAEQSLYGDIAFEFENEKVQTSIGTFYNSIYNYIFPSQSNNETINIDNTDYPLFRYVQANALLTGFEASLTLHPIELIHFENTFSYTKGVNKRTDSPLPFIPAAVLRNELRIEPTTKGSFQRTFISLGLDNVFRQNRVDLFETTTSGYTLLNAAIGTTLKLGSQPLRIGISGNNLLNKRYYDHLSRFKPGRLDESNPSLGFFNAGRNVAVNLYLPFVLKK